MTDAVPVSGAPARPGPAAAGVRPSGRRRRRPGGGRRRGDRRRAGGRWCRTGVAIALPEGYVGLVHPRSGLAARLGVTVLNAPGTVDAGYRGEILVNLVNHDPDDDREDRPG